MKRRSDKMIVFNIAISQSHMGGTEGCARKDVWTLELTRPLWRILYRKG